MRKCHWIYQVDELRRELRTLGPIENVFETTAWHVYVPLVIDVFDHTPWKVATRVDFETHRRLVRYRAVWDTTIKCCD
jgi:hypothetical protein